MLTGEIGRLTPRVLLVVTWVSVSLATFSTILRILCRWRVRRRIAIDDTFVVFGLINLIAMAILTVLVTPVIFDLDALATGREAPAANLMERAAFYLRCQFAMIIMFWTTLWAVKVAILFFYKDLFNRLPKQMTLWWAVLVTVVLFYLGCWASQLASCAPIKGYFWLGGCMSKRNIRASNDSLYITSALDIASDILVMTPLLFLLPGLRVNRKEKTALAGIFSLSVVVIIIAVVRVVQTSATKEHVDPVWLALWSQIEASVAVIVSNLPSFRILITSRTKSAYNLHKHSMPTTIGSGSRGRMNRFSTFSKNGGAIRLDPIHQHGLSDLETLTRRSSDHSISNRHPNVEEEDMDIEEHVRRQRMQQHQRWPRAVANKEGPLVSSKGLSSNRSSESKMDVQSGMRMHHQDPLRQHRWVPVSLKR